MSYLKNIVIIISVLLLASQTLVFSQDTKEAQPKIETQNPPQKTSQESPGANSETNTKLPSNSDQKAPNTIQETRAKQASPDADQLPPKQEGQPEAPSIAGALLFSVRGDIYTTGEIVDKNLYKGNTLYWNVKANTRYAVIVSSESIDTLLRLTINKIDVYRDLYLGENAGLVFTPDSDQSVALSIFSTGLLDTSYQSSNATKSSQDQDYTSSKTLRQKSENQDQASKNPQEGKGILGEYLTQIYQLPSNPPLLTLPLTQEANLGTVSIAKRIATEYRVNLKQDSRFYARISSTDFDTLLEVSDRFGRTIVSDDWGDNSSLISLVIPATDDYFITATSFLGNKLGKYTIDVLSSTGEEIENIEGKISPQSPKILQKFASEHVLNFGSSHYLSAEVQALDNTIDLALVNEELNAIHFTTIKTGETKIIPLYAEHLDKQYKLLVLTNQKITVNYSIKIYR